MATTILVVDDEETARMVVSQFLRSKGYEVIEAGTLTEAQKQLEKNAPDIVMLDVMLPDGYGPNLLNDTIRQTERPEVIVMTAHGDISMAVEAMKAGAHDFIQKPLDLLELEKSVHKAEEIVAMRRELNHLRKGQASAQGAFIIGKTNEMQSLVKLAKKAADASVSVLITGPTGTGKEVLANYIHKIGPRAVKPFIDINCPAIQPTMFESELFGHEAGAFTGAIKRKNGLMEIAEGGILFLDEISSLPMEMQSKLLRVIEERSFRRVGGTLPIKVDVQIIAASNRKLPEMIAEHLFRDDLYYRLKVVDLNLPPLASRRADIPELVGSMVQKYNSEQGANITSITPRALKALMRYAWPGNIRELSNVIERAVLFCDSEAIDLAHLPLEISGGSPE
ncbi:MAG: sigma-54 dependent transcriptional regulator [Anaerolineaceae bacterium]|nr:sigma-54 dependent transcriptional regulator [Anaerolineaceae bacterium]